MYQNKKIDLWNLFIPSYQLTQLRTPVAFIITPGKQVIIRKLPKRQEYFIDKELGMFQIQPENAFFIGKTAMYMYDMRNQNTIDPTILRELWKWANAQHIYKIRRVDVEQAKKLRSFGEGVDSVTKLKDEQERIRLETRKFMHSVLDKIKEKNQKIDEQKKNEAGLDENSEEYKKISPNDSSFIIVKNLYDHGYIDAKQATILNHKLTTRDIESTDDLLHEIESFTIVYVNTPIPMELERVLDDYHTYKPRDVIHYIMQLSKIKRGLGNLRTKPIINWFPATYLLFGALGVGIVIMLWFTYGQQTSLPDVIPKH